MENIQRIKELVKELNNACYYYYVVNRPIMENREYNALYDELQDLENQTRIILTNSPTQRAGYSVVDSKLPKLHHDIPLLSLDKEKNVTSLVEWLGDEEGVLMLKMDGGTGKIEYRNKIIFRLSTRGDSKTNIGEDISHNISSIGNLPKNISIPNDSQIIGEMYMTFEDFNKINNEITKEEDKYANARNLANSTASITDSQICKARNVKFKAFNILKGINFNTKVEQLEWLKLQGFDIVDYWIVDKSNLRETMEKIQDNIPNLEFPIDGLVLAFNDIKLGESKGKTSHHYKSAISFKFEDSFYQTKYIETEFNTSRTGQIVPTGIFEQVNIEGSKVSRATLSNVSIFKSLKLGNGDIIEVSKRNLIIPKIENNTTRSNTEKLPTKCPTCGGKVEVRQENKAEVLYCLNPDCEAKIINKLAHFVSKQCFNIEGLSKQSLKQLNEVGLVNSFVDIFKLNQKKNEIVKLDGWGITSYNNMIESIEKAKKISMVSFLTAIQIKNIGYSKAKDMVEFLRLKTKEDILNLIKIPYCSLVSKKDFGDKTTKNIFEFFNDEDNIVMLNELLNLIEFKNEETIETINIKENFFLNKKVYASGTFANYKKDEIKTKLESLGAEFAGGYAKSLDCLLIGSIKSSSKEDKARKDGVRIIMEDEFEEMIKNIN